MTTDSELWTWERLGDVPDSALAEARDVAHWAVQIVAAAGRTLLEPRADSSHTALTWARTTRAFTSEPLLKGVRAALVVEGLRLVVLRADGTIAEGFILTDRTIEDALAWLQLGLERATASSVERLVRPDHSLPAHPIGEGGAFPSGDSPGYQGLARWYGNASEVLTEMALLPGATPIRCWPHHFDIATLVSFDASSTHPEDTPSVGLGMSPGDASGAEPYWYVNPWPPPETNRLPALALGHWHTEGWVGAQLLASSMTSDTQARTVRGFLREALGACRTLVTGISTI